MHFFKYKKNNFYCENIPLNVLAEKYSTPLYVYSLKTFTRHLKVLKESFAKINPLICFSMKANSSLALCKLALNHGAGLDIVSGGELYKALKIKADPKKIVYAGVGKTEKEIEFALLKRVLLLNAESLSEIALINKVAGRLKMKQKIAIRINPDVEPKTHKYIVTGKKITKFGIDIKTAEAVISSLSKFKNVELAGFHVHIGSQITESEPFKKAIKKIKNFIFKIQKKYNIDIEYVNIGGGLGIVYKDEKPQSAHEFASAIIDDLLSLDKKIIMEPGRFIAGNSGVLVTKVSYIKKTPYKNFAVVDAGMNDLMRPSLYGAYHEIFPFKKRHGKYPLKLDVVGPICESGDFLAKERKMDIREGDYLSVMGAGAYGFSMASNYNSRVLPAEVLVDSDKEYLIRKRQDYSQLTENEIIPKNIG